MSSKIAPHANFNKMNGVIPGEGLTTPPGSMPCQKPPQYVHLDDLLQSLWYEMNNKDTSVQIYGLLKSGVPAEAIARTILMGAFAHGVCTVPLAQLALKTVIRQIVSMGTFLGLKNIKIRNHNPAKTKQLAAIARVIDTYGSVDDADNSHEDTGSTPDAVNSNQIFTGLGV